MAHTVTRNLTGVQEAIQKIIGQHDFLSHRFEHSLRSSISSIDLSLLLSGNIPRKIITNCLTSALQETANLAEEHYEATTDVRFRTIADQLWNPLVATFSQLMPQQEHSNNAKNQSLEKSVSVPQAKKSAKKANLAAKVPPAAVSATEQQTIRSRLEAVKLTKKQLYKTPFHAHIKCEVNDCSFCVHMFNNLNITQCIGHKPCAAIGWYPHVGPVLWQMLKTKHNAGFPCRLQPKACKSFELPSLLAMTDSAKVSSNMDVEQHSPQPVSTVSTQESLDWAEDCSSLDGFISRMQSRKRICKRSASEPPVSC